MELLEELLLGNDDDGKVQTWLEMDTATAREIVNLKNCIF